MKYILLAMIASLLACSDGSSSEGDDNPTTIPVPTPTSPVDPTETGGGDLPDSGDEDSSELECEANQIKEYGFCRAIGPSDCDETEVFFESSCQKKRS